MMRIMETITDKPNWEQKVFNEEITAKWRQEIQDGESVTERMMDYILAELRWKTQEYGSTGILQSYDAGVVKSDTAVPRDILHRLQDLARSLEQEGPKDYHPKSDNKVVDLVHPALFPLVFGRTRVLRDKLIGTEDCFLNVGLGELTTVPELSGRGYSRRSRDSHNPYSNHFQWLPCDVKFDSNGECQIASYINNLHPAKHRDLYRVIEQVLTRTVALWNKTLTTKCRSSRIPYKEIEYLPTAEPEPELASDESGDDEFYDRHDEWCNSRQPKHPDAPPFSPPCDNTFDSMRDFPDLQARYADKGLQVIVKLANIELTPGRAHVMKVEAGTSRGSWYDIPSAQQCILTTLRMSASAPRRSTTTTPKT